MARPDDDPFSLETPRSAATRPDDARPGVTRPDPAPPTAAKPAPTQPVRRSGRRRTLVLVVTGVALVLCLVGTMVGYFTYDRSTKLDRNDPYAAIDQYVEYAWNQHDPSRAKLFRCKDSALEALDSFFIQLTGLEQQYDVKFALRAANKPAQYDGNTATIRTDLILWDPTKAVTPQEVDPWEFRFRDEDGWRLCGAKRLPKPSRQASPSR